MRRLIALLRSDYCLTNEDQKHLADFLEGKFDSPGGRREDLEEQSVLIALAQNARALHDEKRAKGEKCKISDVVDLVFKPAWFAEDERKRQTAINKLLNYLKS